VVLGEAYSDCGDLASQSRVATPSLERPLTSGRRPRLADVAPHVPRRVTTKAGAEFGVLTRRFLGSGGKPASSKGGVRPRSRRTGRRACRIPGTERGSRGLVLLAMGFVSPIRAAC
jgi:hypothetical protein